MGKNLTRLSSILKKKRSTSPAKRVPLYVIVVDLPESNDCCETMLDIQMVNHGKQVTTLSLVKNVVTGEDLGVEYDGRLDERDRLNLNSSLIDACNYIHKALHPLINQHDFKLVIIGAEIDDESESLWVWIDDPENPL